MNTESLVPLFLLATPFILAFLLEGVVLFFFKLKGFWPAFGHAILINLFSLAFTIYAVMPLLGKLGYEFNGLELPVPVVAFLWWLSSVTDALLLQLLNRHAEKKRLFLASICMNALSYLFLYIFIINSH